MKKKNTCNVYQKHLDLSKRIKIEKGIEENLNFSQIAKEINKSPRTVSYEILKNRNIEHCLSWVGKYKTCEKLQSHPTYVTLVLLEKVVERLDTIIMLKMRKVNTKN